MSWHRSLDPRQRGRCQSLVGTGLTQRTPVAVLLDQLMAEGLTHETAILAFVHLRWRCYPRWVRTAALLGRYQSRATWCYGLAILLVSTLIVFVMGWLGWSKNPAGSFGWCWLGAGLLLARAVWQGQAVRWIDRRGSWLFAGLTHPQIRALVNEVQQEMKHRKKGPSTPATGPHQPPQTNTTT